MRVRWSTITKLCEETAELAGRGSACWIESPRGEVLAGTSANNPERHPILFNGREVATVCVSARDGARWAKYLASVTGREIAAQNTVADLAEAQARQWKHMNALMRMTASTHISMEPARIVDTVLEILARATRMDRGIGLIRLPDAENYTVLRADGVDTIESLLVAPLYAMRDEVRLVTYEEQIDGLMHACSGILGNDRPAALARLFTDHQQFGFILAPVQEGETATSEDLKIFGAAAQIISIAIENGCTLTEERQATRLQVENELLCEQTRAMEEMVHVVAHDLRSPMTAVYGFMHVSLDELKDLRRRIEEEGFAAIGPYADSVAEPMRDGIRSVEKLNRMIQRLLDFSRAARAAYSFEKVDLQRLVQGVVRSLGYQLNKRSVRIEVTDLPAVTGDRIQLEAVFGNLIDNAIKYMKDRGDRRIEIGCEVGTEPVFFVRDTGIGMTSDEVSRAFIPFQRFNPDAAPGDGIGLPHVLKIIERHGGRIWCESEKGVGSTFFFTLGSSLPSGRLAVSSDARRREAAQQAQTVDRQAHP